MRLSCAGRACGDRERGAGGRRATRDGSGVSDGKPSEVGGRRCGSNRARFRVTIDIQPTSNGRWRKVTWDAGVDGMAKWRAVISDRGEIERASGRECTPTRPGAGADPGGTVQEPFGLEERQRREPRLSSIDSSTRPRLTRWRVMARPRGAADSRHRCGSRARRRKTRPQRQAPGCSAVEHRRPRHG